MGSVHPTLALVAAAVKARQMALAAEAMVLPRSRQAAEVAVVVPSYQKPDQTALVELAGAAEAVVPIRTRRTRAHGLVDGSRHRRVPW